MNNSFEFLTDTAWITKILSEEPRRPQGAEYPDVSITPAMKKTILEILSEK